jgi:hypothetical protein
VGFFVVVKMETVVKVVVTVSVPLGVLVLSDDDVV